MIKKIPVSELKIGMYIVDVDRKWVDEPIFDLGVVIKTERELRNFQELFKFVWIDTDKGIDAPDVSVSEENIAVEVTKEDEKVDFEEEISRARIIYREAKKAVKDLLLSARVGSSFKVDSIRKIAEEMVESVLRNSEALLSLSRIKSHDEYTFQHSLNVGVLSLSLGRRIGLSRDELYNLTLGSLLHDIGKMRVPERILNKPGKLTEEEFEIIKKHPVFGYKILSELKDIDSSAFLPVLEHHERISGEGYPFGKKGNISLFGKICAITDVYDAITTDRVYHRGMIPYEALSRMYRWADRDFDKKLLEAFVKSVGIYPVGSVVLLSSGEIGVIIKQNKELLRPVVRIVMDNRKNRVKPKDVDLMKEPLEIKRPIDGKSYGIDPNYYIDGGKS